jgi:hypothetical protein
MDRQIIDGQLKEVDVLAETTRNIALALVAIGKMW